MSILTQNQPKMGVQSLGKDDDELKVCQNMQP